ncbi:MAG: polysaccharide biosynthesis/export family protein [Gemmataceae bacterium]
MGAVIFGPLRGLPLLAGLLLLGGCTGERAAVERKLLADKGDPMRREGVFEHYVVQCPDVIELRVSFRPELSKNYRVAADGCIDLGDYGRLRVEGKTPAGIAEVVARQIGAVANDIRVRVAEFRSQHLLLFGQVVGWQRTVPYQGQETVLDVLQRVGGITAGAEPREVYVVRTHVLDGAQPELFQIDLDAIVVKKDMKTNIRLLPYDQIYVGETVRSRVERNFPAWFRPLLQVFWDTKPAEEKGE